MSLEPGVRVGPYEVLERLGAGGMGEVWRARDARLQRDVAIKVLLAEVACDPERLARFDREALLLASLNHARIAAIYGVEEAGGGRAIVMELVEGATLLDRLADGPLAVDEAIDVASAIAEALEAAHEKGIVHRDLKPANVKLTPEGTVKVLDFGLAKAVRGGIEDESTAVAGPGEAPAITRTGSQAGAVLGTAAYMSPEQARGREVDKRSDLWSFGVVVWEMLAGRAPFAAPSTSETLAGVLGGELPWEELPGATPPALRRLLRRCLERDPRRRLRDAGDLRVELDEARAEHAAGVVPPPKRRRFAARTLGAVAAAAALGGLVAGAVLTTLARRSERARAATLATAATAARAPRLHAEVALPEGTRLYGWATPVVAFSPDGRKLAFVGVDGSGVPRLSVAFLDRGETRTVPGSDWAEGPFFSPDGGAVAFAVGTSLVGGGEQALRRHDFGSGITETLCPLEDYFGGDWGADGSIVFVERQPDGIKRIAAAGGRKETAVPSVALATGDEKRSMAWPQFLPGSGGTKVLVTDWARMPPHAPAVVDLATRALTPLSFAAGYCRFVAPDHLVCLRDDGTLLAVGFDPATATARGEPVALLQDVSVSGNRGGVFAVAGDGTLAYTTGYVRNSGREPFRLLRRRPDGAIEELPIPPGEFSREARLSPDRQRAAVATQDGSLWVYRLDRGTRVQVARQPDLDNPAFTPDGRYLVFRYEVQNGYRFGRVALDGGEGERMLLDLPYEEGRVSDVTRDGRLLYDADRGGPTEIWSVPIDGSAMPTRLVAARDSAIGASASPDGRFVAFASDDGGRYDVFVRPFDGGAAVPASVGGGTAARWSPDGSELYYRRGDRLFAVAVEPGALPRLGPPEELFRLEEVRSFDVFARRDFLLLQRLPGAGQQTRIRLVTGWTDELESRLPRERGRS